MDTQEQFKKKTIEHVSKKYAGDSEGGITCYVFWGFMAVMFILSFALIGAVPKASDRVAENIKDTDTSLLMLPSGATQHKDFRFKVTSDNQTSTKGFLVDGLRDKNLAFLIRGIFFSKQSKPSSLVTIKARINVWGYSQINEKTGLVNKEPQVSGNLTVDVELNDGGILIIDLVYVRSVKHSTYYIQMDFDQNSNLDSYFKALYLNAQYVTAKLTNFLLAIRYFFLVISFFVTIAYSVHCYRTYTNKGKLTYEQTMTLMIAATLTLFNDPFFAIYVFNPNGASSFFNVLFLSTFSITMIAYWLNMFESLATRQPTDFQLRRLLIYILLVISLFGSYLAYHVLLQKEPFFVNVERNKAVKVLFVFNILTMIVVTINLLYWIYIAFRRQALFLRREKIFLVVSIVEYILALVGTTSLALSFLKHGNWSLTVVFHANMTVWMYMYMYTLQESDQPSQINNQSNVDVSNAHQEYLDFESNADDRQKKQDR